MKIQFSFLIIVIVLALGLGLAACTEKEAADPAPTDNAAVQTTCPISGEKLGSMGEPVVMSYEGKEVKLCCKSCIKKFEADPAKYAAMVP